jgi:hypothetical protein
MRFLGLLVNLALRAGMFALLRRVQRADPNDPRFVDKGIGPRMGMLVPATQALVPLLWIRHRRGGYPFWMDSLFMSIVALDLAGNVYNLYDRYKHFDLIPHGHGAGAITVFFAWAPGLPVLSAIGLSAVGHTLLEVQEWWSDQFYGFRNVRGTWDIIGDLGSGVVGTVLYAAPFFWFVRRSGREPAKVLG